MIKEVEIKKNGGPKTMAKPKMQNETSCMGMPSKAPLEA